MGETKRSGRPRIQLDQSVERPKSLTHFAIGYGVMVNIVDSHLLRGDCLSTAPGSIPGIREIFDGHNFFDFLFILNYVALSLFISSFWMSSEHLILNFTSVYHSVDSVFVPRTCDLRLYFFYSVHLLFFFITNNERVPHKERGAMQIPNHTERAVAPPYCFRGISNSQQS